MVYTDSITINTEGHDYLYDVNFRICKELYGEDADGNRGITQKYIEDLNIEDVFDEGGNSVKESYEGLKREQKDWICEKLYEIVSERIDYYENY